jgi:3-deoxy-D-manno-octulosonate 8-phosphate phosphatase (KDO 8-P phosphatase)
MGALKNGWPDVRNVHTIIFDFDGVFTDNKVYVLQDGQEFVRCDRADGLAIDFLRRYRDRERPDLDFFIVSTERNPVVAARAQKLRMACHQGVGDKLAFIADYLGKRYPQEADPFAGVVYLGNDLNDLPVLTRAGFSVVPHDAHIRVKQAASIVMPQNGGEGFVRAAIEKILGVDDMTLEALHELVFDR